MNSEPPRRGVAPPDERRDELLAFVSHELRTPLTVILSAGRILQRHPAISADSGLQGLAQDVVISARRLERVVENMLLLARLTDGYRPATEPVLVRQAVTVAVEAHLRDFPDADVQILAEHDAGMTVEAVPTWVRLILLNLLRNASEYGTHGRPVVVQWNTGDSTGRIHVCNSDDGRASPDYERWFEPFFRSEPASQATPGAGLGLTIASRLAEQLGGELTARRWETEPGTIMTLSLPLASDA